MLVHGAPFNSPGIHSSSLLLSYSPYFTNKHSITLLTILTPFFSSLDLHQHFDPLIWRTAVLVVSGSFDNGRLYYIAIATLIESTTSTSAQRYQLRNAVLQSIHPNNDSTSIILIMKMWAMCLLYLGPNFRPGVEYDYHLSPILAPSELLAAFPPVLLQCGGRDPLVDDTMHFGGRLKEAKRQARAQRLQKKQATGGQLPTPSEEPDTAPEAQNYTWTVGDDIDDAEDAVKMQIFPGWSHGYLQMSSIMREAKFAIDDIADWMQGTFERRNPPRPSLTPSISVAQF